MPSYLSYISASIVVMIGWYVVHGLNIKRDKSNKRDEMILQYLLEAYRRLESAACRENSCEDLKRGFESAIADIQLLGSSKQISQVEKFARLHINEKDATVNDLMRSLRDELRLQLGLEKVGSKPVIFRFKPEINVVSAMTCDEN